MSYDDAWHLYNLIKDGIIQGAGWAATLALLVAFRGYFYLRIKNAFFNDLSRYSGKYYAYRWAGSNKNDLVKPTVEIKQSRFGRFYFRWSMPGGHRSSEHQIINVVGREIYAFSEDHTTKSYSYFVLHANAYTPVDCILGTYCFMNVSYEIVSGPFLLSKRELTAEEVEQYMPPAMTVTTQDRASRFYRAMQQASRAGSAVSAENDDEPRSLASPQRKGT